MSHLIIAVDGEGGDFAPQSVAQGLYLAKKKYPQVQWKVYCYQENVKLFEKIGVNMIVCESEGNESNGTMQAIIKAVKNKEAHACVSAGNTTFYFIEAIKHLNKLPLIKRPALISSMPSKPKDKVIIDIGANLQCSAFDMAMFAIMGRIYAKQMFDRQKPKVSFLNIGSEPNKGPAYIREARTIYNQIFNENTGDMQADFIEGDELFSKDIDVIVMDGFTGNVLIKFAAGFSKFLFGSLKAAAKKSLINMFYGLFAKRLLKDMKDLDHHNHNSGILMGLDGLVIKGHGNSNGLAFASTLCYAVKMANQQEEIINKLKEYSAKVAQIVL